MNFWFRTPFLLRAPKIFKTIANFFLLKNVSNMSNPETTHTPPSPYPIYIYISQIFMMWWQVCEISEVSTAFNESTCLRGVVVKTFVSQLKGPGFHFFQRWFIFFFVCGCMNFGVKHVNLTWWNWDSTRPVWRLYRVAVPFVIAWRVRASEITWGVRAHLASSGCLWRVRHARILSSQRTRNCNTCVVHVQITRFVLWVWKLCIFPS